MECESAAEDFYQKVIVLGPESASENFIKKSMFWSRKEMFVKSDVQGSTKKFMFWGQEVLQNFFMDHVTEGFEKYFKNYSTFWGLKDLKVLT